MMMKKMFLLAAVMMGLTLALGCGQPFASKGSSGRDTVLDSAQSGVAPKYQTDTADFFEKPQVSVEDEGRKVQPGVNDSQNLPAEEGTGITREEAKAAALEKAGVREEAVERLHINKDQEDGRPVYEVEFYVDYQEYEFEIDAYTGEILEWSAERLGR